MRRPQNLKKSPTGFDKTVLTQFIKPRGTFFQIFVAYSEKLDFERKERVASLYPIHKRHHFIGCQKNLK